MKKWENRKNFNLSHFCLVESEKIEGWKNEFVWVTPLLKNDDQLKQKKWQKNSNHPIY